MANPCYDDRYLELVRVVRNAATLQEKLDALADSYKGQDCWLLAPGPSAGLLLDKAKADALNGKLVIAIKQAFNLVPDTAQFHLKNHVRYTNNDYPWPSPIVLFSNHIDSKQVFPGRIDLALTIPATSNEGTSVCVSGRFDDYPLATYPNRPHGPGITDEIGFPLVVHLGCKRVFTLGFDMESITPGYFDDTKVTRGYESERCVGDATQMRLEWLRSHGIEWYRIASELKSPITAPSMSFDEAIQ